MCISIEAHTTVLYQTRDPPLVYYRALAKSGGGSVMGGGLLCGTLRVQMRSKIATQASGIYV